MGYQVYEIGEGRFGGYGVPAYCDHPDCNEEIDRGMAYACGGEPFSELGCPRYFCSKHVSYTGFKCDGSDERCDHEEDCECTFKEVCERCEKGEAPFDAKPEHPDWVKHVLKDSSWKEWRRNHRPLVTEYRELVAK